LDDGYKTALKIDASERIEVDVTYEVTELKKDIYYLENNEDTFMSYLESLHSDFSTHVESGAAASGKTMFCKGMVEYLKKKGLSAVHVPLDGYLIDRETRNKQNLSGYDPKASDLSRMIDHMKTLIYAGKSIDLPIYDHKSGNHRLSRRIEPAGVIILDRIMSLQFEIRERFPNLNIFFTSKDIVIRGLRLLVDMEERGYSVFQALAHSDEEFVFYNKWIYPQITFAHLKIWVGEQRELYVASE
jgi:phosphoribulokinase